MRWRFVDQVTAFQPWRMIAGTKVVSLEEYYLLEPLGREGVLPESLVIECLCELARWLVVASSSFTEGAVLDGLRGFSFARQATMGERLDLEVRVTELGDGAATVCCTAASAGCAVASGELEVSRLPLAEVYDAALAEALWGELNASP